MKNTVSIYIFIAYIAEDMETTRESKMQSLEILKTQHQRERIIAMGSSIHETQVKERSSNSEDRIGQQTLSKLKHKEKKKRKQTIQEMQEISNGLTCVTQVIERNRDNGPEKIHK